MAYISQEDLEGRILKALYDYIQSNSGLLSADDVASLLGNQFSSDRVAMALRTLDDANFLRSSHNMYSGSSYSINDAGYRKVEKSLLSEQQSDVSSNDVPAADRVVSFDHNSKAFKEVISASRILERQLSENNDLGDLSEREGKAASFEVSQIADQLEQPFSRPRAIWTMAKSTLEWVGREAAGAVVGTAALALLALLAHFLGFA